MAGRGCENSGGCGTKGSDGAMGKKETKAMKQLDLKIYRKLLDGFSSASADLHFEFGHLREWRDCSHPTCKWTYELVTQATNELRAENWRRNRKKAAQTRWGKSK